MGWQRAECLGRAWGRLLPATPLLINLSLSGILMGMFFWSKGAIATAPPVPLSETEILQQVRPLLGWKIEGQQLRCTVRFKNFVEAIAFTNQLIEPSEAIAHHPDLRISYNQVLISLTTHDAGGISMLDIELAKRISRLSQFPGCQSNISLKD